MSAYDVIRVIREKSGGITNTTYLDEMAGTPESFRKLIQNERRIEFAFENQRFWDLRRWLLPLNESILGMEVTRKEDSSENFEVKLVEERYRSMISAITIFLCRMMNYRRIRI